MGARFHTAQMGVCHACEQEIAFDRAQLNAVPPKKPLFGGDPLRTLVDALRLVSLMNRRAALTRAKKIPPIRAAADDPALLAWLKRYPDPDLWHLMV